MPAPVIPVAAIADTFSAAMIPASSPPRPAPEQPQDAVGAKAFAVLNSYCAGCHQQPSAAGGIGKILDLTNLARDRSLVRPGVPDASRLYQTMLMRHAPMEQAKPNETGPSPLEIEALRDWIESLPASERQCPERQPVDSAELANTMQRWLEQSKPEVAKATRFISLAHLYNACANDAELAAYRQAVQKLLNGLSWARAPVRIETVGDFLVVLALRLNDIGWVPAHWDRLAGLEPAGGAVPVSDALKQMTGSPQPVLRADWLASAASRAPLYYELLGLPDRARELMRLHGLDIDANARPPKFTRAGLKSGGGLRGPMLAERHVAKDGQVLWLAYEWAAAVPPTDVFDSPLAPHAVPAAKSPPKPDATRFILALPNGMLALGGFDAEGRRLDVMPAAAQPPAGAPSKPVAPNGVSSGCIGCHATGLLPFVDEMRPHHVTKDARDPSLASYPSPADLAKLFEDDNYHYRRALVQAGVDPDLTTDGLEITGALGQRFERPVDLERAAADAGEPYNAFRKRLAEVEGDLKPLAQRLLFGLLPRAETERLLVNLRNTGQQAAAPAEPPRTAAAESTGPIAIGLWPDQLSYKAGDLVHFSVQTSEDCYLTLVDIDAAGKATVLFPNDFEQDNLVSGGRILQVPSEKSPYQLRLKEKGTETLAAMCSTTAKIAPGIELDFERQRFPSLGIWRNFLRDAHAIELDDRMHPEKAKARGAKLIKGRPDPKTEPPKPEPKLRSDGQGRAAITIRVE